MIDVIYKPTKRLKRILVAILLPPPLGVFILSIYILCIDLFRGFDVDLFPNLIKSLVLFTPIAYILFGLQSILYAFVMEFFINPNIKNSFFVIIFSILLGMLSGIVLGLMGTDGLAIGVLIGAVVGLIVGMIVRRMYCRYLVEETIRLG
ncbi:hypothetical protein [Neisseria sp. Ec49-e6-T10]|uniref:hypothetical protein n=1 Tax=Neisseria sp. Ec49-e6-T10 TaxID=3140744 RepID=UPI003EB8F32F